MLTSALNHYRNQQQITAAGLLEARKAGKRGPREVAKVVTAYQVAAAREAVAALPLMLDEQNIPDAPVGAVAISGLVGRASDGRPLETLFGQAETDTQLALMVATQLQDIARLAAGIGVAARPNVGGYARMLNPPSCSRCAILAGKFFKWNTGFQRHPRCDCRHIPSTEALAGDLTTDPRAYFNSLSAADQASIFGKANAEAIREGADIGRVVNAYRGTSTTALETAKSARFRDGVGAPRPPVPDGQPDLLGFLPASARADRSGFSYPTPEGIYQIATSRAEAIRLLREYGYLL
jgi:hypothetical protein